MTALGFAENYGLTTVVLAYLTQIWARMYLPLDGEIFSIPITGSGFIDTIRFPFSPWIIGADIEIVVVPDNIDMIFGELPIYYLGMAGFGSSFNQSVQIPLFGEVFDLGINTGIQNFDPPIFLNHLSNNLGIRDNTTTKNLVWWHLKPGVRGFLTVTTQFMGPHTYTTIENADPFVQAFNPLEVNPWQDGQVDGGLNPVH